MAKKKKNKMAIRQLTEPRELVGTWHIHATNFSMWLSGKRDNPKFIYRETDSPHVLLDTVSYTTKSGHTKTIKGKDTYDSETGVYTWRGTYLLRLVSSKWRVLFIDKNQGIAIIAFEKSLLTSSGIDIISRHKTFDRTSLKSSFSKQPNDYGLSEEQYHSLTWL